MTDLFATIEAADDRQAKWPFPAKQEREAAERRFLERIAKASNEGEKADTVKPVYDCSTADCRCDACQIERGEAGPFNDVEARDEPAPHASRAPARAFPTANLTVLALDLGTTTGWALAPRAGALRSGSFRLDPHKLGGNGRRWIAFREWLTATAREVGGVQVVYYEDVKNHAGVIAAHVYGGYLAMLEAWCAANNVRLEGVGVGTVKKHFTGNGRAEKGAMIAEARRRGMQPGCDNEADAMAILAYGVAQES